MDEEQDDELLPDNEGDGEEDGEEDNAETFEGEGDFSGGQDDEDDGAIDELEEVTEPSLTYRVSNGHIAGKVDELEAMEQAIKKLLVTDRFTLPIYTEQYGGDFEELIGKDYDYCVVEVERMLQEALEADDRIRDVEVTQIEQVGRDGMHVVGNCATDFGTVEIDQDIDIEGVNS